MLPIVEESVSLLTYYNNVNALIMFMPMVVLLGEVQTVWNFKYLNDHLFWTFMIISGAFGFLISYVTMLQIQVTSPLTHNVSGTAKACAQTVIAVICFGQVKSLLWWVSNVLVLVGSASYTRVRQLEMLKQHQEVCKEEENEKGKLTVV